MIYDIDLEKKFLATLIQNPGEWLTINGFFSEKDLFTEDDLTHSSILTVIKQGVEKGEDIDSTIVAQRVEQLGFKREGDFSTGEYVRSLALRRMASKESVLRLARELKKLSVRRALYQTGQELQKTMKDIGPSASYAEILDRADTVYNKQVNHFELDGNIPVDLYAQMEALVEERGNNPIEDFGMTGPFETINKIYGSLVRPGNINVICARSKVGKTSFGLYYCTHLAAMHNTTILHLDNGEMSQEELVFRQCASLSGVKLHYIETGKWRKNPEMTQKVRSIWPTVKKLQGKFYYYCVAGMSPEEMCALAEKFYYNVVGRGNEMTISFDYLKTTGLLTSGKSEWQVVGEMVDGFKQLIQKKILFEGKPKIGLFTYVQANRSGITKGKNSGTVIDDESVVSLSDRISHLSTHLWYLRKKTPDEIMSEGPQFGTHKLICLVARHLGKDAEGHNERIKVGDELRDNFINLEFDNFFIKDCGDLRDIVKSKGANVLLKSTNSEIEPDDSPPF